MDRVMTAGWFAGWAGMGLAVAVVTGVELLIAVDLLATGDYSGWRNWPLGAGYVALVAVVVVRVATKRTSFGRATLALLALDAIALPVAAAVLSM